ncbi:lipid-A-disaccharide synthase [Leptolyngbyaceae cyanobacterium CCMR0082]|uniref:Lipid-A-disaccharide synthase n=1 Tax=Adonisia turfae CCMR0082 TaxID=2304604 RepID=A0A6M0RZU4_9CYAN|nr:lipid-A-disaccharide synthase [Adonisia turfae]NEZ61724.1 lipid-A-disaccharide synthase [Adonisia turfae CCMR0082]
MQHNDNTDTNIPVAVRRAPASPVRVFIHTGEVSGDLQGALLVEGLKRQAAQQGIEVEISAMGGDRMAAAGAKLIGNTVPVSSIGIFEALPHAWAAIKMQRQAKQHLLESPPDVVVLIDYMGPNVAIGQFIRRQFPAVPITYFIAPQLWVWAMMPGDTEKILSISDRVLAIFPGEARYYREKGGQVSWVGHPLLDKFADYHPASEKQQARQQLGVGGSDCVVTLLPASRPQELTYVLPIMLTAAQQIQTQIPQIKFLIPLAREAFRSRLEAALKEYGLKGQVVAQQEQALAIAAADLAIAKSGTANLEIALMEVPQVVMYRLNRLTAWVAEFVLKFSVTYVSPVNLVNMEPIVPEFVQWDAKPDTISQMALNLLNNPDQRQKMVEGYRTMRKHLGSVGVCDRAANEILALATGKAACAKR